MLPRIAAVNAKNRVISSEVSSLGDASTVGSRGQRGGRDRAMRLSFVQSSLKPYEPQDDPDSFEGETAQDKLAYVQASRKPEVALQCDPVPPTGWGLLCGS